MKYLVTNIGHPGTSIRKKNIKKLLSNIDYENDTLITQFSEKSRHLHH
jgi:hypothetical protein